MDILKYIKLQIIPSVVIVNGDPKLVSSDGGIGSQVAAVDAITAGDIGI